jgi:hypothetical protein
MISSHNFDLSYLSDYYNTHNNPLLGMPQGRNADGGRDSDLLDIALLAETGSARKPDFHQQKERAADVEVTTTLLLVGK